VIIMNYKPAKKWEDFYNINKSFIDKEVEALKNTARTINDNKNRDKYFQNGMREIKNKLIGTWSKTKK